MKKVLFASLFLVSILKMCAAISWETTHITQKADPLAESISATFKFQNTGDTEITIEKIKSSCGCTTAALEKKTYAPGESGEITATFNIGSRQGLQSKSIRVTTDNESRPTVLIMKTLVPEVLSIKPSFVFWRQGEEPEVKSIHLRGGLDEPIRVLKAESSNSNVRVELVEVEAGRHYRLDMFPASTDELGKARITVVTDYPTSKPKKFYAYAHVK